jgi:hypothetical protein
VVFVATLPLYSQQLRTEGRKIEPILQLCTDFGSDAHAPHFYRIAIERITIRSRVVYGFHFIHIWQVGGAGTPIISKGFWETGGLREAKFKPLWEKILALQPASMESVRLAPGRTQLTSAESWVTLRLGESSEVRLFFSASPADESVVPLDTLPEKARTLLELLWESRGFTQSPRVMQIRPPRFEGYCFDPQTQQQANDLVRGLPTEP